MAIEPNTCVRFTWIDDDLCEIYVDDNYVGELDHETHGWAGVQATVEMLNRIILLKGWRCEIDGDH